MHVGKNTVADGATASMTFTHQQDVQVLTQDVRHILTSSSRFLPRNRSPWMTWTFALGMLVAPLTFAGGALRRRRHTLAEADVRGTRNRLALRALKASLKQELTIEVVGEAMEQYLMAKLGWERSQLTRDAVRTHLKGKTRRSACRGMTFGLHAKCSDTPLLRATLMHLRHSSSLWRKPPNPRCHEVPSLPSSSPLPGDGSYSTWPTWSGI